MKPKTPLQLAFKRFMKNKLAVVCLIIFAFMLICTIIIPEITGHSVYRGVLEKQLQGVSLLHPFGTDTLGRDLLTRTLWGVRITLATGLLATLIGLSIGIFYGLIAGYFGRWLDNFMMRIVDILYGLPTIIFVVLIVEVFRDYGDLLGFATHNRYIWEIILVAFALGMLSWLTIARIVRAQVLSIKEKEFVEAARALGAGPFRIMFVHIFPNLVGHVIVYMTLSLPSMMLFESFISFLGLGIKPPNASLGGLIDEGIRAITPLGMHLWLLVFPAGVLAILLFCLNAIGDGLRDTFDVR
jgi:oligopeptide transport system permease protein